MSVHTKHQLYHLPRKRPQSAIVKPATTQPQQFSRIGAGGLARLTQAKRGNFCPVADRRGQLYASVDGELRFVPTRLYAPLGTRKSRRTTRGTKGALDSTASPWTLRAAQRSPRFRLARARASLAVASVGSAGRAAGSGLDRERTNCALIALCAKHPSR